MSIIFEDVSFSYPSGVRALHGISLEIKSGESLAILGENGAGKTTLARHINGLLKPSHGRVIVGDRNTDEYSVANLARQVGYVFQNPDNQLFERTVWAEVAFGPRNLGRPQEQVKEEVERALRKVSLEDKSDFHPYDLHPSERKIVALAAILAMETPILIMDEPTTGQDERGILKISQIIEDLKREGRTVIAISHDVDFCAEHFHRVILLSEGEVIGDGEAEEILAQPDLLARGGVEAPQLIRLSLALDFPSTPLTVERFVEGWLGQKRQLENGR